MKMKRLVALIMTVCLLIGTAPFAFAATDEETYKSAFTSYADMYRNDYVPCYHAYNDALSALGRKVDAATGLTQQQYEDVISFLTGLVADKRNFFGDRSTAGKSRYVVPQLRNAMYDAAGAEDYAGAYGYCQDLTDAVLARINFLNGLKAHIDNYDFPTGGGGTGGDISGSASVTTTGSKYWYDATLKIYNTSSTDISGWNFGFDYTGSVVNDVWANGSTIKSTIGANHVSFYPETADNSKTTYTIPAGGHVTIKFNGVSLDSISNATLNGVSVDISYTSNVTP